MVFCAAISMYTLGFIPRNHFGFGQEVCTTIRGLLHDISVSPISTNRKKVAKRNTHSYHKITSLMFICSRPCGHVKMSFRCFEASVPPGKARIVGMPYHGQQAWKKIRLNLQESYQENYPPSSNDPLLKQWNPRPLLANCGILRWLWFAQEFGASWGYRIFFAKILQLVARKLCGVNGGVLLNCCIWH